LFEVIATPKLLKQKKKTEDCIAKTKINESKKNEKKRKKKTR